MTKVVMTTLIRWEGHDKVINWIKQIIPWLMKWVKKLILGTTVLDWLWLSGYGLIHAARICKQPWASC